MKILFIIQKLYNGGAEHVIARLSSELSKRHEVYLALTDPEPYLKGKFEVSERVRILHVDSPMLKWKLGPVNLLIREASKIIKLRKLKKEHLIDISVSFLSSPNLYNVLSASGVPAVISVRNMMSQAKYHSGPETALRKLCDRFSGSRADRIVAVSRNVSIDQQKHFGVSRDRISVIYNPLDWEAIRKQSEEDVHDAKFEAFRKTHQYLIVNAGRLTEQKAQWHLIRILKAVREKGISAGLVLFGYGELETYLRQTADENHVGEHVLFAGYHTDPFDYLGKCDIYVMSSLYEGFSNVMLEAMACGLPIAAADGLSGPRELLAPDTDSEFHTSEIEYAQYGILTPPLSGNMKLGAGPLEQEECCLADAVTELLLSPERRDSYRESGFRRVKDFSIGAVGHEWEALLDQVLASKKARHR